MTQMPAIAVDAEAEFDAAEEEVDDAFIDKDSPMSDSGADQTPNVPGFSKASDLEVVRQDADQEEDLVTDPDPRCTEYEDMIAGDESDSGPSINIHQSNVDTGPANVHPPESDARIWKPMRRPSKNNNQTSENNTHTLPVNASIQSFSHVPIRAPSWSPGKQDAKTAESRQPDMDSRMQESDSDSDIEIVDAPIGVIPKPSGIATGNKGKFRSV